MKVYGANPERETLNGEDVWGIESLLEIECVCGIEGVGVWGNAEGLCGSERH